MNFRSILITCGGTGGHFYPGLAIAKAMQKRGGRVKLLLAGKDAPEQIKTAAAEGVESLLLPPLPPPFQSPFRFAAELLRGFFICRKEIQSFKPDALLGMGAFTSAPLILTAILSRIPLFLHDGNAKIGKANRYGSRFAKFLAAAFPPVNADKCKCPVLHTGMPIREKMIASAGKLSKEQAIRELNELYGAELSPELPTVLIFGGSQGAAVFNAALPEALLQLDTNCIQVLHLTGFNKLESTLAAYKDAKFKTLILERSSRMELFLTAADQVFCRAGGSSVAELTLFGCPAVLIPFPFAAENHQWANAEYFANSGAGVALDNYELSPERAKELISDFLTDREKWVLCGKQASALAKPAAADDLLDLIDDFLKNGRIPDNKGK